MCLEVESSGATASKIGDSHSQAKAIQDREKKEILILVRELHRFLLVCQQDADAVRALDCVYPPCGIIKSLSREIRVLSNGDTKSFTELKNFVKLFFILVEKCEETMSGQFELKFLLSMKEA